MEYWSQKVTGTWIQAQTPAITDHTTQETALPM